MEAELRAALSKKGTHYRGVDAALLGQLVDNAQRHGMDAKAAAAAFDKFMAINQ